MPKKINAAINPWITENLNELLHDTQPEEQQPNEDQQSIEKNDHIKINNQNLLSSLLIEIVNILEIISKPQLKAESNNQQTDSDTIPAPLATHKLENQKPKWQKVAKTSRKQVSTKGMQETQHHVC